MVVDWGPHDVSEAFYRMWMVCALIFRDLELTDWVMWRPCEVDVRCHPDVRGLNAALCGAYYSEQRCGCGVPHCVRRTINNIVTLAQQDG